MYKLKNLISLILALAICLSFTVPISATEIASSNGTADVPIVVNVKAARFSVTVPTGLPIDVDENGNVVTATDAKIINNSIAPVKIEKVEVISQNGWELIAFDTDKSTFKIDEKKIGLQINSTNEVTQADGSFAFDDAQWRALNTSGDANDLDKYIIDYDAIIAPQSENVTNAIVANVVFTVDWDKADYNGVYFNTPYVGLVGSCDTASVIAYEDGSAKIHINGKLYTTLSAGSLIYLDTAISTADGSAVYPLSADGTQVFNILVDGTVFTLTNDSTVVNTLVNRTNGHLIGYTGAANEELVIPKTFVGEDGLTYNVVSVESDGFFNSDNLKSVTIPESVTFIDIAAFSGCSSLENITVDENNPNYCSIDGVLYNKEMTTLVTYPAGNADSSFDIPDSIKTIENSAFYEGINLTSIIIPDNVTTIGWNAFGCCENLKSVTIPDGVTSIEPATFEMCSGLTSITIPESVTNIGVEAFNGCTSLTNVYYTGSENEWNAITVGVLNESLTNATIHYNYIPDSAPPT